MNALSTSRVLARALWLSLTVLATDAPGAAGQTIRTVRAAGPGAAAPWNTATADLAGALAMSVAGDEVWIAAGTYKPAAAGGASTATFTVASGVKVYGGFAGTETARDQRPINAGANPTILSGDINGTGTGNSFHVVTAAAGTAETMLDRLRVTGGIGPNLVADTVITRWSGTGLYAVQANVSLTDCVFVNCAGGQVYIDTFYQLRASPPGGAVYISQGQASFVRCTFSSNHTAIGGSSDCRGGTTRHSTPGGDGGAVYVENATSRFEKCGFFSNFAGAGGIGSDCHQGGLGNMYFGNAGAGGNGGAIGGLGGTTQIIGCTFLSNSAGDGGAAAFGPNESRGSTGAGGGGGAIWWSGGAGAMAVTITNCDFRQNRGGAGGPISNSGIPASGGDGGAVALSGVQAQIVGSAFAGNSTGGGTGAMPGFAGQGCVHPPGHGGNGGAIAATNGSTLIAVNLTIVGSSTGPGGAGYAAVPITSFPCNTDPTNCVCIATPAAERGRGAAIYSVAPVNLANSIVWDNAGLGPAIAGLASAWYSCNQDAGAGIGVISADPRLTNPSIGLFAPLASSPCIDRGDSTLVPATLLTDLAGLPRIVDASRVPDRGIAGGSEAVVDMGAVESPGAGCTADADGSGVVDVGDIFYFLAAYFALDVGVADINGVGGVSVQDVFDFLGLYVRGC